MYFRGVSKQEKNVAGSAVPGQRLGVNGLSCSSQSGPDNIIGQVLINLTNRQHEWALTLFFMLQNIPDAWLHGVWRGLESHPECCRAVHRSWSWSWKDIWGFAPLKTNMLIWRTICFCFYSVRDHLKLLLEKKHFLYQFEVQYLKIEIQNLTLFHGLISHFFCVAKSKIWNYHQILYLFYANKNLKLSSTER